MKKMTALVILDGFGHSEGTQGNAIKADGINNISRLLKEYPHTLIEASGEPLSIYELACRYYAYRLSLIHISEPTRQF